MVGVSTQKRNAMTGPTVQARRGMAVESAFRTSVTGAFCGFLLIKLAAPEVLDTGLSVGSQLLLLVVALLLAAAAAVMVTAQHRGGDGARAHGRGSVR